MAVATQFAAAYCWEPPGWSMIALRINSRGWEGAMEFKVVAASYDAAAHLLSYTATGFRNGLRFTVSSRVKCLKNPSTDERLHLVVLLALSDHFKRPSPSGHRW